MSAPGAPVWMVRVNPLERRRLADAALGELVEEATALERECRTRAAAASDDLYRLVPAAPEHLRGRLLALRRDIHNGRGDGPAEEGWGIDLPSSVSDWAEVQRRRRACHQQIRDVHAAALARERARLRDRLGDENFLTTVAQSASGVYDAACRYRRHQAPDSADRKAERALLQYLTRAMVRTSPYGRFTAVGLATPGRAGPALDEVTPDTATAHVELDRALFDYVMGGLVPAGTDPLVAVPPTATVGEDRVTFFQMGPETLRRLSAPLNRHTKVLVDLVALGPRRRSEVAAALAAHVGIEPEGGDRLVGAALGLGLLVTAWRGDEFVAEPVGQALLDLTSAGQDRVPDGLRQMWAGLDRLGDKTAEGTGAGAGERLDVVRRLHAAGNELSARARRPARLAVNEDFVLDPLGVDPGPHRPALDDLAAVTELLCAFDRAHVLRALASARVVERFGAGCRVSLVDHAESLVRAVYQDEEILARHPGAPVGPGDASLAMLAKIRDEARTALSENRGGGVEVRWTPGDVRDLVAAVPERFRRDPASYGVVVQPVPAGLVLNDAYAGHGPMLSRFLHADQVRGGDSVPRLRSRLGDIYGPAGSLVEDGGRHSLSINAHPPVLDRRLDPAGWQELALVHDRETDRLWIADAGGVPVRVLALGAQLPELFPYPVRLATWLCSSGRVVLDIAARAGRGGEPTAARPRVRVGGVVVSRRRWYPGSDLPVPSGATGDAGYLLALTRWRARHDVPAEVVFKSAFDGPTAWSSLGEARARETFFELRRQSKPQYADLASAVMTRVLPRLLERRPDGYLEEALPAVADGGHALEWMIEMSRPAGATRFAWDHAAVGAP